MDLVGLFVALGIGGIAVAVIRRLWGRDESTKPAGVIPDLTKARQIGQRAGALSTLFLATAVPAGAVTANLISRLGISVSIELLMSVYVALPFIGCWFAAQANGPSATEGFYEKVYNGRQIPRPAIWLLVAAIAGALIAMGLSSG